MHRDDHMLDRAFDGMPACARARKVMHRPVGMVIAAAQARAGATTRGRCP